MNIKSDISELIGGTPLVELKVFEKDTGARIAAKLESFNPAGSAKDRVALSMILDAEEKGVLKAVGYRGKEKVAEHTLFTAEEPIQLVQNVIPGKEVDCVIVEAQDKKGHRNPLCNEWVDIEANGAKVIGIDNGTQYDPEGLKYTSTSRGQLYEGRLIFYVKKGQTEYKATVRSTAL